MINEYVINSLLYNDDYWNLRVVGQDEDLDILSLDFRNLQFDKNALINLIRSDRCTLSPTISIDAELLNDDDIVNALREKNASGIRIINENYILTEEDYRKLDFAQSIYVDRVDNFNYSLFKVFTGQGIYKRQYEKINSDEEEYRDVFHITHRLNDTEIGKLVMDANNCIDSEIDLDLYDPSYYHEFITKLEFLGLKRDININLLSNVLVDTRGVFDELKEFKNNINIKYSSNPEVINYYTGEPFGNLINYDNQLEINASNSLDEYIDLLRLIDGGEEYIHDKAYSPLEAIVWTYKYIRENDLNTDRSNVFSAILRRAGEKVFRYSSLGSNKNILRVTDPKYSVDTIGVVDFNIDVDEYKFSEDFSNYLYFPNLGSEYCNFIYSLRDMLKCYGYDETLAVSNSLVLDQKTYNELKYRSSDNLEVFYNTKYDDRGNTYKFLELIGIKEDDKYDLDDLYEYINKINEDGLTKGIDDEVMFEALLSVERSVNPAIDDNEIQRIKDCYRKANEIRDNNIFIKDYHVVENYEVLKNGQLVYDEKETLVEPIKVGNRVEVIEENDNMVSVVEDVETMDDYISGTNIKRPRSIKEGESLEEYNVYYRQYFNKYLLPVINSNIDKEEEFLINSKDDEEAMVVVDDEIFDKDYDTEAIVVSLEDYNKHNNQYEDMISMPFMEFAKRSDHIVMIPFDKYNEYKNEKELEEETTIITKEIFDKYFRKDEEKGKVVSKEVYNEYIKDEEPIVVSKRVYLENEDPIIVSLNDYDEYSNDKVSVSEEDYNKYIEEHTQFINYEDYDEYLKDSRGIVVSKEIYDVFAQNHDEIISIPVDEYLKQNDNVLLLSYDIYNDYKKKDNKDYRIISDEVFKKYFGNDENLVDAIVVSKEDYEKHVRKFTPMKKSIYGDIDEKYLSIINAIDKELFSDKRKRIN